MKIEDGEFKESNKLLTAKIVQWSRKHYRIRSFNKDERIPTRPGLLYLVKKGAVRIVGKIEFSKDYIDSNSNCSFLKEVFLGFIDSGKPFEIVSESCYSIEAYAHLDRTEIFWLYWKDLENWSNYEQKIYKFLQYQYHRKLLWLTALSQQRTEDRLIRFLYLLVEEHGVSCSQGWLIPYLLTHAQIASIIGSTRVTVTRLMVKLRHQGTIFIREDRLICVMKN